MKDQDLELLRGRRVVVLNSSYQAVPFADILLFADSRWWYANHQWLGKWQGLIISMVKGMTDPRVRTLARMRPPEGLSSDPCQLPVGRTVLHAGINLCVLMGAKRIVLLGADMRRADDGTTHHHKPHIWDALEGNKAWDFHMQQLKTLIGPLKDAGVEVINTSPVTRINWWPVRPLADVIEQLNTQGEALQ